MYRNYPISLQNEYFFGFVVFSLIYRYSELTAVLFKHNMNQVSSK